MTRSTFPGLPPECLKFLCALGQNNNREWFDTNKQTYLDYVKAPTEAFAAAVSAEFTKFAPVYATDPKRSVYRIYRDTRFSANKTPYKTHVSALFYNTVLGKHQAGAFYVEISPKYVGLAAGVYMPDPERLRLIRLHIMDHHQRFIKLVKAKPVIEALGELQGEKLSRPPKGFPPDHPAIDWIKHKNWYYWRELDPSLATSPKLIPEIVARFKKTLPVVEFLNEPVTAAKKKLAPLILDL